jgi:alkylated DNA repair dioxygenase AlkB
MSTAKEIKEKGYVKVDNMISKEKAKELSDFMIYYCENNPLADAPDFICPKTKSIRLHPILDKLLEELTPKISKITGKTLYPTFSFGRLYKKGDDLPVHTDRHLCEYSITLCLGREGVTWPIWMSEEESVASSCDMDVGDAVVYMGCRMHHWREPYEGEWMTQVFLHWVDAFGPYADYKFGKRPYLSNHTQKNTPLSDYVVHVPNVISPDYCDLIVEEYRDDPLFEWAKIGVQDDAKLDFNQRKVRELLITNPVLWKDSDFRKSILENIINSVGSCLNYYNRNLVDTYKMSASYQASHNEGLKLLHYKEGYSFKEHVDGGNNINRVLTCSINLSDNYEGGEFKFFNESMTVPLAKGDAVIFPSSFLFPHQITELTKGERYSIITWLS